MPLSAPETWPEAAPISNSGSFANDNRINGDGALFIRFTGGETVALFVRFSVQSTTTDDQGNPR
jgi:uncharacterized protein YukJ